MAPEITVTAVLPSRDYPRNITLNRSSKSREGRKSSSASDTGWLNLKIADLIRLLDRSRARLGLGVLGRPTVAAPTAIRAHNLGILVGHFVQKSGKRLTT